MQYCDFIISPECTVADAMKQLQDSGQRVLFIAPDDRLLGVVSDGDIRRFLLSGSDMNANIMQAATLQPLAVEGFHEYTARKLLRERGISCVPMTDTSGRVHALVFADHTLHRAVAPIDTPVIIMAGGLGTRLRPYTEILPKPLIPVGGKTITEHILAHFMKFGCSEFHLVVNHKKALIKSYFSEVDTGAQLNFVDEDKPLGTGGGLSFFAKQFDRPVLVTYCDSVIEADYAALLAQHERDGNLFTMVCAKRTIAVPYGVIEQQEGRLCSLREKPCYELLTNTGLYVVSPEFMDMVPKDTFTPITDVVERCLSENLPVGVFIIEEECFIDIGQLEDLHGVEDKLL